MKHTHNITQKTRRLRKILYWYNMLVDKDIFSYVEILNSIKKYDQKNPRP